MRRRKPQGDRSEYPHGLWHPFRLTFSRFASTGQSYREKVSLKLHLGEVPPRLQPYAHEQVLIVECDNTACTMLEQGETHNFHCGIDFRVNAINVIECSYAGPTQ